MILFPADTLERSEVERDYRNEFDAARAVGLLTALFDFDGLQRGEEISRVLRRVPEAAEVGQMLVYRGWMLTASDYARLYHGLEAKGWKMRNDARAYQFGHHAPENYALWREWMAQTAWIGRDKFEQGGQLRFGPIFERLRAFGNSAVIVKDWVKSQKSRWEEACFVSDASDEAAVRRVVSRFLELQGEYLTGGLVFRRFERLRRDASGQTFEWRSFWLDGQLLSLAPNPVGDEEPPLEGVAEVARECPSRFFTLDFAQKESGEWMIIEMGDGGVSGLPPGIDVEGWYHRLMSFEGLKSRG